MGLFSKFKKKRCDGTVVMLAMVYTTLNPSYAARVQRDTKGEGEALIKAHFVQLVQDYYLEECRPPREFNNYYTVIPFPAFPENLLPEIQFWDDRTKAITDRGRYNQVCREMVGVWRTRLQRDFPKYDSSALEDGLENVHCDYYPSEGVIMLSMWLDEPLPV